MPCLSLLMSPSIFSSLLSNGSSSRLSISQRNPQRKGAAPNAAILELGIGSTCLIFGVFGEIEKRGEGDLCQVTVSFFLHVAPIHFSRIWRDTRRVASRNRLRAQPCYKYPLDYHMWHSITRDTNAMSVPLSVASVLPFTYPILDIGVLFLILKGLEV